MEPGTFECGMFMWKLGKMNLDVELVWNLEASWNLRSEEPCGTGTCLWNLSGPWNLLGVEPSCETSGNLNF